MEDWVEINKYIFDKISVIENISTKDKEFKALIEEFNNDFNEQLVLMNQTNLAEIVQGNSDDINTNDYQFRQQTEHFKANYSSGQQEQLTDKKATRPADTEFDQASPKKHHIISDNSGNIRKPVVITGERGNMPSSVHQKTQPNSESNVSGRESDVGDEGFFVEVTNDSGSPVLDIRNQQNSQDKSNTTNNTEETASLVAITTQSTTPPNFAQRLSNDRSWVNYQLDCLRYIFPISLPIFIISGILSFIKNALYSGDVFEKQEKFKTKMDAVKGDDDVFVAGTPTANQRSDHK